MLISSYDGGNMHPCPLATPLSRFVCWFKVHEADKRPSAEAALIFIYCNTVAQILVFFSSCCNPVIYGIFNQNYSQYFLLLLLLLLLLLCSIRW